MTAVAISRAEPAPLAVGAAHWRQSLGLFVATLAVFLLLPQRALHGVDADVFIAWIAQGQHDYPRHFAYLHLAGAVHAVVSPLGGNAYHALLLASALGSALAAVFVHRAFLLLAPREYRIGVLPTLAVVATGPCFYFATCVEIHGVFAAAAAASWWALARFWQRPSPERALLFGASTGLAATVHAFGHLLLPSLLLAGWFAGGQRRGLRGSWLLVAGAAHALCSFGVAAWFAGANGSQSADVVPYLLGLLPTLEPATTPAVLWREWLLACAPWSLLAVYGLFHRRSRAWSLAASLGVLVHLPLVVLLLGHHRIVELGAYMIGIVPAAVLASARLLRPRGFALATLVALAGSLATTAPRWREPAAPEFVAGVVELAAQGPFTLVVGKRHELEGARKALPNLVVMDLAAIWQVWDLERKDGRTFAEWFDAWYPVFTNDGKRLLLAGSAHDFLAHCPIEDLRTFWDQHVPTAYVVQKVERRGFAGAFLLPPRSVALR